MTCDLISSCGPCGWETLNYEGQIIIVVITHISLSRTIHLIQLTVKIINSIFTLYTCIQHVMLPLLVYRIIYLFHFFFFKKRIGVELIKKSTQNRENNEVT